jgi:hypothetical protein
MKDNYGFGKNMDRKPPVLIFSDQEEILYGREFLEEDVAEAKRKQETDADFDPDQWSKKYFIVKDIPLEMYIAYLWTHFANHKAVQEFRRGPQDLYSVYETSKKLTFTVADAENLKKFKETVPPFPQS